MLKERKVAQVRKESEERKDALAQEETEDTEGTKDAPEPEG